MSVLYIGVAIFVTCLLLALPLFPFWKFCRRLKSHHPAFYMAGPFDFRSLVAEPGRMPQLLDLIHKSAGSLEAANNDRELLKWARVADGLWQMAPRGFLGQVGFVLIFLYFTWFLSGVILKFIG